VQGCHASRKSPIDSRRPQSAERLEDHLDVTFLACVKFRVRTGSLLEREAVTDHSAGFGCAGDDHVAQLGVPALVIVAAHDNRDILVEKLGPRNGEPTLLRRGGDRAGVSGGPDADDRDAPGGIDELRYSFGDPEWVFPRKVCFRARLKADGVDGAGDAAERFLASKCRTRTPPGLMLLDLFDRVATEKVDGNRAQLARLLKAFGDGIDGVDPGRPAESGRVRCQQSDGARAENGNGVTGATSITAVAW
jgi:hypothetical protein